MAGLVKRKGWKQALSELLAGVERVHGGAWFARNRTLLSLMDCEELLGFDGDVEKILSKLPDSHDFKSVQTEAQDLLIEEVHRQLRSGGSTLFFDFETMQTKRTAVLMEDLSSARKREFTVRGKSFLDRLHGARDYGSEWLEWDDPLRYTHYGFNLLWSLCHRDGNSHLGHCHNREARELLSKALIQLADPTNPVPDAESGIPSPTSARLLQLVDAAFRCIEWLGPNEDELFSLDMLSSKRGPSLGILFESGHLDAFAFASCIASGREWALRNAESLDSLDVPLALETVGIHESALWEFTAMSEIDYLLCWALKALAGRNHPRFPKLLKDVAPLIYSFESGAFAELLDSTRPEGYVGALVALGRKLYETCEFDDYSYLENMDRVISVLVRNADHINDADRSEIIRRIQSRADIFEPPGQSHGAELASSFVDDITKQNDIVLRLLPRKNGVDRAKSMLVGDHFIGHHHYSLDTWVHVYYVDINVEDFLTKNKVDVVETLTRFVMPDYGVERLWIKLAVAQHIIDSHKESVDSLRNALLNAETQAWVPYVRGRKELVAREDDCYFSIGGRCENEDDHNYEDELMAILGDIGPFAVMGEVLLSYIAWDKESVGHAVYTGGQAGTRKEEARDSRRSVTSLAEDALKDLGPAKALEALSRLSIAERQAAVLRALKHTHPRPRAGACWYVWLTGTESSAILQELNRILKANPNDEIVLAALDKLARWHQEPKC